MKFAIMAGHDDREPGNMANGLREADLMLELRHIVALKLRQLGHEVVEDGQRGVNKPLSDALRVAAGVELAVELHTNASDSPAAQGVEIVAPAKRRPLAQKMAQRIAEIIKSPTRRSLGWYSPEQHRIDRGWKNPAAMVRAGGMIVEVFFQSNPRELANYRAKYWLVADAIATCLHEESLAKASPPSSPL